MADHGARRWPDKNQPGKATLENSPRYKEIFLLV
jgi:hypothetical protein